MPPGAPFFSPDGQWLGFFADGKLKKISIAGEIAQTLVAAGPGNGAVWVGDDTIVFSVWVHRHGNSQPLIDTSNMAPVTSVRVRVLGGVAFGVIAGALVWNAQAIAIAGIHGYQRGLAPIAARVGLRCRFTPTCSRYAEIVIARDGITRGGWKALTRIARCGPWTPTGTLDEP